MASIQSGKKLKKVDRSQGPDKPKEMNPLDQIRLGTKLKKASERKLAEPKPDTSTGGGGINVAALMAAMDTRRMAIDDSDEDSDGDWDDEDSDW